MIIKLNDDEKKRIVDAIYLIWDIMDKIEYEPEVTGVYNALDEGVAHLVAIHHEQEW